MTENLHVSRSSPSASAINEVRFSVLAHAAWAPGLETPDAWSAWANGSHPGDNAPQIEIGTAGSADPPLAAMPAMLRRRASLPGKMALNAAYSAISAAADRTDIPVVFCSRHGECGRSAELLIDLAQNLPLSPTAFSLSVHNATGGLFSIARRDHANSLALAAGHSTIEHAAIEACSLLADGANAVLLVASDGPLPEPFSTFTDCNEQSFGWAWLMQAAKTTSTTPTDTISLRWTLDTDRTGPAERDDAMPDRQEMAEPGGLQIMRFFLRGDPGLQRTADNRRWIWSRHD
ncbi:MAG: 3-oxoacyl-(acyl-carrier-protein) synthase [Herbaspirillum sp.]|nr:3-oxoacyl-(acyl-carrier-protein) synthase [Herbaspirillum sp.]